MPLLEKEEEEDELADAADVDAVGQLLLSVGLAVVEVLTFEAVFECSFATFGFAQAPQSCSEGAFCSVQCLHDHQFSICDAEKVDLEFDDEVDAAAADLLFGISSWAAFVETKLTVEG